MAYSEFYLGSVTGTPQDVALQWICLGLASNYITMTWREIHRPRRITSM